MKGRSNLKKYHRLKLRRSHLCKTTSLGNFSIAGGNSWKKYKTRETCYSLYSYNMRETDLDYSLYLSTRYLLS